MQFVDESDKIFFNDFKLMCQELQSRQGMATVGQVPLPPEFGHKYKVNDNKLVGIYNIEDDEVFERLNKVFREVFDDDDITVTETTIQMLYCMERRIKFQFIIS